MTVHNTPFSELAGQPFGNRDRAMLAVLGKSPEGNCVKDAALERFAEYEGSGLVKLSTALIGPLRQPHAGYFWAVLTEQGREFLQNPPACVQAEVGDATAYGGGPAPRL